MNDLAPSLVIAERFWIEREVGRGAGGVVYRARDRATGTIVALKVMIAPGADLAERARLAREGQLLAELDHSGIVRVAAYGVLEAPCDDGCGRTLEAGTPFVAMEWLEGEDLAARQLRAPLTLFEALEVGRQVADALAAAHEAGIVHRDVKPTNIFLLHEEAAPTSGVVLGGMTGPRAKLVDFGVASVADMNLTATGAVVGTPAYMAPEQARGDASASAQSDIYSLGATLFELIAGRPPHRGPNSIATLARLVTTPAPRLSELLADVPPRLDDLLSRMLSADPAHRPTSARQVSEELAEIARDPFVAGLSQLVESNTSERYGAGTRLVTTLVAIHVARGNERAATIDRLRQQGADALPLGDDSLVAHLGAERAYGDEAARALQLSLSLAVLGARVGVATGRMRVGRSRAAGEVVDRAAALARQAEGGGLLADGTTADLARGRYQYKRVGQGVVSVMVLEERRDTAAVGPFLGRDAELSATILAFERCVEDATPVMVSISGPPGIGKSQLCREFMAKLEAGDVAHALTETGSDLPTGLIYVRCESFGRSQALGTATDALRGLVGLPKGAALEQATQALAARPLARRDDGLLARLLVNQPFPEGVNLRGARDALYLSMTEVVLAAASTRPCAIFVEDAQWCDAESVAWSITSSDGPAEERCSC